MSFLKKIAVALILSLAFVSGGAQSLLGLAAHAEGSGGGGGGGGGSCGGCG